MKKLILFSLLLLFMFVAPSSLLADEYQDVVYLKNGSIIHGIIIEQIPGESIKIENVAGDIFVFTMDEIEKITKEKISGEIEGPVITTLTPEKETKEYGNSGFMVISRCSFNFQLGNGGGGFFALGGVFGGRFGFVGIGGGIEGSIVSGGGGYEDYNYGESIGFLPIYGEIRFFFLPNSGFKPIAFIDPGMIFTYHEYYGNDFDFFISAGSGIEFWITPASAIVVEGGYRGFNSLIDIWHSNIFVSAGTAF